MKATCILPIFFVAVCLARNTRGSRILGIFPLNMSSHFVMFQEILTGLADKGHRVDVVSHFPMKKPRANYTNVINLIGKSTVITNNVTLEAIESMGSKRLEYRAETYGNEVCNLLGNPEIQMLIKNPPSDPPYDLVVTELFYANCYFAFGRHFKIPVVAVSSSAMPHYANEPLGNPLNTAFVPGHNEGSIFHMNFWQRFKNTIVVSWENCRFRRKTDTQNDIMKKYFGPEIPGVRELERDLSLVLVNSHHTLNGVRPNTPAVVEVGGLHVRNDRTELSADLKEWLDNGTNGFIYISFGTLLRIESFPNKTLAELSKAFAEIAPIRVLMKAANPKDLPISALPRNVVALEWINQVQVLKHRNIRGFITHGGLMGVQEAVTFGVPFIGVPIFADQPQNVKNCVDMGVAVSLDYKDLTADKFIKAVNAILYDPSYKNNMMVLSKRFLDRPTNALDTAVFWIEYILRHGGDSLRSPAVKLSWWELALLDIYGSLLIAALITLYLLKRLMSVLIRRIIHRDVKVSTIKKVD